MLDQDFCEFLEYKICKALEHSDNDQIKGFWCDGVLLNQPDNTYSQEFIKDSKQIKLKAFIGNDGQTEYELTLKFGNRALIRFGRCNRCKAEVIKNCGNSDWSLP